MQLMSWSLGRLGSRFGLQFDPHRRRVMHSALGRMLDEPLDLAVGLIDPDGTERVLPFTDGGEPLQDVEQFERVNSITFRGHAPRVGLRFEFNVHSVFYPQDEGLCAMPAFYLECRVNPAPVIGTTADIPERVRLFLRLDRPDTQIAASNHGGGWIDLAYRASLAAENEAGVTVGLDRSCDVQERIASLNEGCEVTPDGRGLMLDLPVTRVGSGTKWRLVWGAFCGDPVGRVERGEDDVRWGRFHYTDWWEDLDAVMAEAIGSRDYRLSLSRRFEKLLDEASLDPAERHLLHQGFQSLVANTWWLNLDDGTQWFSAWDGATFAHSPIDVEYNAGLFYLSLWPDLLAMQLRQWSRATRSHEPSDGAWLARDLGRGPEIGRSRFPFEMEVEANADFLLLLQAFSRFTSDLTVADGMFETILRFARYLQWADTEDSGFATAGTAGAVTDADPAARFADRQVYLSVKRVAGLQAAADLLGLLGREEYATGFEQRADRDARRIDAEAWRGDHYAVCVRGRANAPEDPLTGRPAVVDHERGEEGYSIYSANGLMLPAMTGRPWMLETGRLTADLVNATRETLEPYGCAHTTANPSRIWISQNIWRDLLARYARVSLDRYGLAQRYWDRQVAGNTGRPGQGFVDSYGVCPAAFSSRGGVAMGLLLGRTRLRIDRLAPGGQRISVDPDRHAPGRWPLLPLADWKAGKIPVCVVNDRGRVVIESESDPIIIHGQAAGDEGLIG